MVLKTPKRRCEKQKNTKVLQHQRVAGESIEIMVSQEPRVEEEGVA